eukprot:gene1809-3507_t
MEAKHIEARIISHDSVIHLGISTVGLCASKFQAFTQNIKEKKDHQESVDALIRETLVYLCDVSKTECINYDNDMAAYKMMEDDIERRIQEAQISISQLSEELSQQQQIRKHKEECDAMAKIINEYPTSSTLQKQIDSVKHSLGGLNDQIEMMDSRIQMRSKQFQLVVHSITDLQKTLSEDEEFDRIQAQIESMAAEEEEVADDGEQDENEHDRDGGHEYDRDTKKQRTDDAPDNEADENEASNVEPGEVVDESAEGGGAVEPGEVSEETGGEVTEPMDEGGQSNQPLN